jgi:transcriptional regulator with XRE-family HTH domain
LAALQQRGRLQRAHSSQVGLKQEDVAAYLKIHRMALVDIESGQRRVEAIELTRLTKLCKQPVSYFTVKTAEQPCPRASRILRGKLLNCPTRTAKS